MCSSFTFFCNFALLLCCVTSKRVELKINLGGESVNGFTAEQEVIDVPPDAPKMRYHGEIKGPGTDLNVFKTQRFARNEDLVLHVPVPDGIYTVSLLFAETWNGAYAGGKRIFDVYMGSKPNGIVKVCEQMDPFRSGGPAAPVRRTFRSVATQDGLTVALRPIKQNPQIAGIVIEGYSYSNALLEDLPTIPAEPAEAPDFSILDSLGPRLPADLTLIYDPSLNPKLFKQGVSPFVLNSAGSTNVGGSTQGSTVSTGDGGPAYESSGVGGSAYGSAGAGDSAYDLTAMGNSASASGGINELFSSGGQGSQTGSSLGCEMSQSGTTESFGADTGSAATQMQTAMPGSALTAGTPPPSLLVRPSDAYNRTLHSYPYDKEGQGSLLMQQEYGKITPQTHRQPLIAGSANYQATDANTLRNSLKPASDVPTGSFTKPMSSHDVAVEGMEPTPRSNAYSTGSQASFGAGSSTEPPGGTSSSASSVSTFDEAAKGTAQAETEGMQQMQPSTGMDRRPNPESQLGYPSKTTEDQRYVGPSETSVSARESAEQSPNAFQSISHSAGERNEAHRNNAQTEFSGLESRDYGSVSTDAARDSVSSFGGNSVGTNGNSIAEPSMTEAVSTKFLTPHVSRAAAAAPEATSENRGAPGILGMSHGPPLQKRYGTSPEQKPVGMATFDLVGHATARAAQSDPIPSMPQSKPSGDHSTTQDSENRGEMDPNEQQEVVHREQRQPGFEATYSRSPSARSVANDFGQSQGRDVTGAESSNHPIYTRSNYGSGPGTANLQSVQIAESYSQQLREKEVEGFGSLGQKAVANTGMQSGPEAPNLPVLPDIPGLEEVMPGSGGANQVANQGPGIHNGNDLLDGMCVDNRTHCSCGMADQPESLEKCLFVVNEKATPMICVKRACSGRLVCACAKGANTLCKRSYVKNILVPASVNKHGVTEEPDVIFCRREYIDQGVGVLTPIL